MINDPQPEPIAAHGDMWLKVIEDMEARRLVGMERYNSPLQAFNGRDAMIDLYQELLDATVYARQYIEEGMDGLGCRHKPGCIHYCEEGHVTADEMAMLDIERLHWEREARRYKDMLETFTEFVRATDAAMLDAFVFNHAPSKDEE